MVKGRRNKDIIKKLETAGIAVVFSESHGDRLNSISAIRRLEHILGVAGQTAAAHPAASRRGMRGAAAV